VEFLNEEYPENYYLKDHLFKNTIRKSLRLYGNFYLKSTILGE